MSQSDYKQGQNDAAGGKGPKAPNQFDHWKAREDYNAGYNKGKNK